MKKQDHLIVTDKVRENLKRLIPNSYKIGISGQGDPILNQPAALEIFKLPGQKRYFEFLTSGNIPTETLLTFILTVEDILKENNDFCRLRLSIDRYHLAKNRYNNILPLITMTLEKDYIDHLDVSFRSVTSDREYIVKSLIELLSTTPYSYHWLKERPLNYKLIIEDRPFNVEFHSVVNSPKGRIRDIYTPEEYIDLLSEKYGRPMSFGSQYGDGKPGLDITVNPSGDIVFYGLECEPIGNICTDDINQDKVADFICRSEFYSTLVTVPLKNIISKIRENKKISKLIDNVNSPYWIIRNIHKLYPDELRELVLSLKK